MSLLDLPNIKVMNGRNFLETLVKVVTEVLSDINHQVSDALCGNSVTVRQTSETFNNNSFLFQTQCVSKKFFTDCSTKIISRNQIDDLNNIKFNFFSLH